jgi:excisionase family DNA binding protein
MSDHLTQLKPLHLAGGIEMDELLSVEEAARRLGGLSKYTIEAWLSKGKLMRTKVGRRTMIRASELQRVIEDGGKSPANRPTLQAAQQGAA